MRPEKGSRSISASGSLKKRLNWDRALTETRNGSCPTGAAAETLPTGNVPQLPGLPAPSSSGLESKLSGASALSRICGRRRGPGQARRRLW